MKIGRQIWTNARLLVRLLVWLLLVITGNSSLLHHLPIYMPNEFWRT